MKGRKWFSGRRLRRSKKGGIALEAAIATPLFLVLMVAILQLILCIRSETLLMQATDQVTAEMRSFAVVAAAGADMLSGSEALWTTDIPLSEGGKNALSEGSKVVGGVSAVVEFLGLDTEDILTTLLVGETVRDRILAYYYSYSDHVSPNTIGDVSVYLDLDNENKKIDITVYYKRYSLFGIYDRTIYSSVALFDPILLTIPEIADDKKEDDIWQKGNFERGLFFREKYGGNLPATYPVIAVWENHTATSIKSMDTTAPGYASAEAVEKQLSKYIDDLYAFNGTESPRGKEGVHIIPGSIVKKKLLLIIPQNTPAETMALLRRMQIVSSSKGIDFQWEYYGTSTKYSDSKETVLNE